jgi:hypothetical protein
MAHIPVCRTRRMLRLFANQLAAEAEVCNALAPIDWTATNLNNLST